MDITDIIGDFKFDKKEETTVNIYKTSITNDQFDDVIKVIDELYKISANDAIIIKDSKIIKDIQGTIYYCELSNLIGHNRSLDIIDPKEYLSSLKEFKDSKEIFISYNEDIKSFVISDNQMSLNLPKYSENINIELPELKIENIIAEITIDKKIGQKIKTLEKKATSTNIVLNDNSIIGFEFLKGGTIFSKFELIKDKDITKSIKCMRIIPFTANDYKISVYHYNNDTIAFTIICSIGNVNVTCIQICKEQSEELSFSDIM